MGKDTDKTSLIELLVKGGFWTAGYLPKYGIVPIALEQFSDMNQNLIHYGSGALLGLMVAPMLIEPFRRIHPPTSPLRIPDMLDAPARITLAKRPPRIITVGGMKFDETDMFYNFMCTGSLGSGKTSSILFPAIEQLINLYSEEDDNPLTENPYAKLGGISLDVKGEFWEPIALFMHRAGRNVFRDCRVVRVKPFYPIGKFYDPDAKERRYFYLNAMEASSGKSDCGKLLQQVKLSDGSSIRFDLFARSQDEIDEHIDVLREHTYSIDDPKSLRFLGWRQKGGKLHRVSHHAPDGSEVFLTDEKGRPVTTDIPKRLKFVRVVHVSNNLRWNIVNNRIPSQEAAARLAKIAEMVQKESGSGGGGNENPYFTESAKRLITNCLEHFKIVYPDEQCEASFIYRMAVNPKAVEDEVKRLDQIIHKLKLKIESLPEDSKKDYQRLVMRAESVREYFGSEWKELDQKTKTITASVVSNMTQPFMGDAYLRESFCSPETYSFEESVQHGRFFCFVPGGDYENMGKIIGTALKIDFQSVALSRIQASYMGKARRLAIFIDEYQRYAIAGGSSIGDDNFTSLARQAKSIFFSATQSYAWFESTLGKNPTRALLQSFTNRIFLQNMDPETNKTASELCGTIEKENGSRESQEISMLNLLDKKNSGRFSDSRSDDRKARYRPDVFQNLNMLESITFNKGESNSFDKVVRKKNKWHWIGGGEGDRMKAHFLHWYFQGEIESCLENIGKFDYLDPDKPDEMEGQGKIPQWRDPYTPTPVPVDFSSAFKMVRNRAADAVTEKLDPVKETPRSEDQTESGTDPDNKNETDSKPEHAPKGEEPKPMNQGVRGRSIAIAKPEEGLKNLDATARNIATAPAKKVNFRKHSDPETEKNESASVIPDEMDDFIDREFSMARFIHRMGQVFGQSSEGDPVSVTMDLAAGGQRDPKNGGLKSSIGKEGAVNIAEAHQVRLPNVVKTPPMNSPEAPIEQKAKSYRKEPAPKNTPGTDEKLRKGIERNPFRTESC